jgi:nanoRNase/pAp phosphatase (c-di-AMP/oligoRNAs hydrolase)
MTSSGGGHKFAAGYTGDQDADAVVAALVAELTSSQTRSPVR